MAPRTRPPWLERLHALPGQGPGSISSDDVLCAQLLIEKLEADLREGAVPEDASIANKLTKLRLAEGATGAQAGGVPTVSLVAHLQAPMADALIGPGSRNSHHADRHDLVIELWKLSTAELDQIAAYARSELGGTMMIASPAAAQSRTVHLSEAETNHLFFVGACQRLNDIYNAKGTQLVWRPQPPSQLPDNTVPDLALWTEDGAEVMVGEGKFHSVLDDPRLAQAYNEYQGRAGAASRGTGRVAMCNAVAQECNYLHVRGIRYGFLTTYRHTFFIKRIAFKRYAITDAYLCTSTKPSVPEMLFYMAGQALAEGKVPIGVGTSVAVPVGDPPAVHAHATGQRAPSSAGGPAKVARTDPTGTAAGMKTRHMTSTCADTSTSSQGWAMIPEDAVTFGRPLGRGACGLVSEGRLFGQVVAIKCVDAYNSADLVPYLQHEASVLSGRLASLQGLCVPVLHACGFWQCGLVFLLATSLITGSHPFSGAQDSTTLTAAVEALRAIHAQGVAHGDISADNIIVGNNGKVCFIDFGQSTLDPTPAECEEELLQLRSVMSASPGSDQSARERV